MSNMTIKQAEYYLGHSEHEMSRLQRQHRVFAPFTRQFLQEAGILPGMKVLDVGCGTGDVTLLLSEMVGAEGHVTSLDFNQSILQTAQARAAQQGITNITFVQDNLEDLQLEGKFDAVVGRWILMWVTDPVRVLRHLSQRLNPGGIIAFQETIFLDYLTFPFSYVLDDLYEGKKIRESLEKLQPTPERRWIGLSLYHLYQEAGLPTPQMRIDTPVGGGADWEGYQLMEDSLRSLLPAIQKVNPDGVAAFDIDTFAARLKTETIAQQGVIMLLPLAGAWAKV